MVGNIQARAHAEIDVHYDAMRRGLLDRLEEFRSGGIGAHGIPDEIQQSFERMADARVVVDDGNHFVLGIHEEKVEHGSRASRGVWRRRGTRFPINVGRFIHPSPDSSLVGIGQKLAGS